VGAERPQRIAGRLKQRVCHHYHGVFEPLWVGLRYDTVFARRQDHYRGAERQSNLFLFRLGAFGVSAVRKMSFSATRQASAKGPFSEETFTPPSPFSCRAQAPRSWLTPHTALGLDPEGASIVWAFLEPT